jgi:hypothetical protein
LRIQQVVGDDVHPLPFHQEDNNTLFGQNFVNHSEWNSSLNNITDDVALCQSQEYNNLLDGVKRIAWCVAVIMS